MAERKASMTQHPVIQLLQESFEQWQTLNQPLSRSSTESSKVTKPSQNSEKGNTILIKKKRDIHADFPPYNNNNYYSLGEKRICKRYFTNDIPKKKSAKRKSIYYLNVDSKDSKNILNALPEIYGNRKVIQEFKNPNFLSPYKRSPNIKVLTIDLVPKGENLSKTVNKYTTQEIEPNSLLGSKMGKGEFLILIQQPKNQANINNLLEEIASSNVKKDAEDNGENSAFVTVSTPQQEESVNNSNVPSAVGKMLKLFMKSDAYYKDLSSRLNNIYNKIVETKLQ